jgi:hypothetical protein
MIKPIPLDLLKNHISILTINFLRYRLLPNEPFSNLPSQANSIKFSGNSLGQHFFQASLPSSNQTKDRIAGTLTP